MIKNLFITCKPVYGTKSDFFEVNFRVSRWNGNVCLKRFLFIYVFCFGSTWTHSMIITHRILRSWESDRVKELFSKTILRYYYKERDRVTGHGIWYRRDENKFETVTAEANELWRTANRRPQEISRSTSAVPTSHHLSFFKTKPFLYLSTLFITGKRIEVPRESYTTIHCQSLLKWNVWET